MKKTAIEEFQEARENFIKAVVKELRLKEIADWLNDKLERLLNP